jgi:hypothetical protein
MAAAARINMAGIAFSSLADSAGHERGREIRIGRGLAGQVGAAWHAEVVGWCGGARPGGRSAWAVQPGWASR